MSETSPIPWKPSYNSIVDADGEEIVKIDECSAQDLCHIVNCVNQHDSLVAEVERLSQAVSLFSDEYTKRLDAEAKFEKAEAEAGAERFHKIIDKMAEYISKLDINEDICSNVVDCLNQSRRIRCKECIKKYFESEAKS